MTTNAQVLEPAAKGQRLLPLLLLLFVGSGCAALIYEIVWYQLLQLVIGLTTISLGVLLGTFMGGMCLGSLLLPRLISRRAHPLAVYALLEIGIGIIGILVLHFMPAVARFYTGHFGPGVYGMIMRGLVAVVCLLPPTLLMGATLPAIARWVESTPQGVSWLGFFYGGNIAGAVFGCLLAGFYLLREHNAAYATYVAAAINFGVGALGLLLAFLTTNDAAESEASKPAAEPISAGAKAYYVVIALSGCAALGAEVIWTRLLSLILGGTVYTFSNILAVFLVGLGIGSAFGSFVGRDVKRPGLALAFCQAGLLATIFWAALMISDSLPHWPVDPMISLSPWYTFQLDLARCVWTILPASCLWGASFPLALAAVSSRGQDPGRLVGGVYAANTVGAILGALLFSIFLVPAIGTQHCEQLLLGIAAVSAIIAVLPNVIGMSPANSASGAPQTPVFSITGVIALLAIPALAYYAGKNVDPAPWGLTAYGRYMATYKTDLAPGIAAESAAIFGPGLPTTYCIYAGEGLNGSVCVTDSLNSGNGITPVRSFHSAGKVQASNDPFDMKLQRMLGHVSALAVPDPKSVLVIACGAGVTAGTFVLHPSITREVICDIEPLVPQKVAPLFAKENYDVVGPSHKDVVQVALDDGRHYIRTSKEKFDIISSDPIDPWVKGCAALNTVEYYQMCKDHLNPGGVMSLWIPLYEGSEETTKSIISTFFTVFPNGIIWSNDIQGAGYDAVLFGQAEPSHFDLDKLQARIDALPEVKQSLADVGFNSAVDLMATFAGRAQDMGGWMQGAEINNDADMRLQYVAGWNFNSFESEKILDNIMKYRKFPSDMFSGSPEAMQELRRRLGSNALPDVLPANAMPPGVVPPTQ